MRKEGENRTGKSGKEATKTGSASSEFPFSPFSSLTSMDLRHFKFSSSEKPTLKQEVWFHHTSVSGLASVRTCAQLTDLVRFRHDDEEQEISELAHKGIQTFAVNCSTG